MQNRTYLRAAIAGIIGIATMGTASSPVDAAVLYGVNNPVSMTLAGYTQNFDSLPAVTGNSSNQNGWYISNGTDNVPRLPGWDVYETVATSGGTGHERLYGGSTPTTTGAFLDLGKSTTAGSNRALGMLSSSTIGALYMGVTFTNDTGSPITSLDVSYTGEIWRSGGANTASSNYIEFLYKIHPTGDLSIGTDGSYVKVSDLKFNSPVNSAGATALDGTLPANQMDLSGTIDLSANPLAPGDTLAIRWQSPSNGSTTADALAIDNLVVTPTVLLPEPASLSLLALGALPLLSRKRRA